MGDWTFFSNYGHVLVCLARNRQARLRDVAQEVGITERAVQKIVRDMQDAGFLTITKQGRCNRYQINKRKSLRHSLESRCTVGKLLALVVKAPPGIAGTSEIAVVELESTEPETPAQAVEVKPEPVKKVPPEPKRKKAVENDKKKKTGPVDTRQQGSLF